MAESENKKANFSESMQIIKKTASEMKNKNKKLFKVCVTLFIILVLVICAVCVINTDTVKVQIVNAIIPNHMEIDQTDLIFYSEPDPNYDSNTSKKSAFDMFRCYYYPDNDKSQDKVYLESDGIYHYPDGTTKNVALVFVIAAMVYMSRILTAFKIAIAVIVVALVALAIFMWYRADEKRYKEAQERIKKMKKRSH